MAKFPVISAKQFVAFFKAHGFQQKPRKGGSHITLKKAGIPRPLVIPDAKELSREVVKSNLATAGLSREDLIAALQKRKGGRHSPHRRHSRESGNPDDR